jgi:hypothetical protein
MINNTLSYLYARAPLSTICFSGTVSTASVHLAGPGGASGNGFPLPRRGYLTGLHLWDGSAYHFDTDEVAFAAGDCISIYCQAGGSDFTVKVRVNGNTTSLQIASVPFNSTLFATIEFLLIRD